MPTRADLEAAWEASAPKTFADAYEMSPRDYFVRALDVAFPPEAKHHTAGKVRPECAAAMCGRVECDAATRGVGCYVEMAYLRSLAPSDKPA